MKDWHFYFTDIQNKVRRELLYCPDEWRAFGVSYGRESRTTITKTYAQSFTFVKEDAFYLKDILVKRGFNAKVKFEIYAVLVNNKEELQYDGYIDFYSAEASGNTFKADIVEGGFFTALENNWDKEQNIIMNVPEDEESGVYVFPEEANNPAFRDVAFTGGEYEFIESLGLLDETQKYGDVQINIKTNSKFGANNYIDFLPIKKIFKRNSKLQFFNNAKTLTVRPDSNNIYADEIVTKDQCYIVSPDKHNAGNLDFNFFQTVFDIEFEAEQNFKTTSGLDFLLKPTGDHLVDIQLWHYIYNDVGLEKWRPYQSKNLIVSNFRRNTFSVKGKQLTLPQTKKDKIKIRLENINLRLLFQISLDGYLNNRNDKTNGYMCAFGIKVIIDPAYQRAGFSNWNVGTGVDNDPITLIPHKSTIITYINDHFRLNVNRTIHGIYPSDLFRSLIDKFNATYGMIKTNPPTRTTKHKYKLSINTTELDNLPVLIASGTSLLGSKQDLIDSGIQSSVKTTLSDFTETMYKVFALKLFCRYDRATDTYFLSFLRVQNCYNNSLIQDLGDSVADLTITSDRENLYTSIKVGYSNSTDAIFGQLEYNTTNNFDTGNTERETNELDLVSKYKGGALDLETYVHEKYHNYEDTQEGASDLFFVEINRTITSNDPLHVTSIPITAGKIKKAINTGITPRHILRRHKNELLSYLIYTPVLKFMSSERNANFNSTTIGYFTGSQFQSLKEDDDLTLTGTPFIKPFLLDVTIPAVSKMIKAIDSNPLGFFQFRMGSKVYKGYLADGTDSASINPMNETSSTLKLIAHSNSDL